MIWRIRMTIVLKRLLLLILSGGAALGLAEGALRLAGRKPYPVNQEQFRFWEHDPVLGWRHRAGQSGIFAKDPLFRVRVRINKRGLRDREYPEAKPPGKQRILVLGDSFAWGFGVEEADRFDEVMERSDSRLEVISAGVSGYSTDQELLWFEREGVKYRADLVVLLFVGNDHPMNAMDLVYNVYYKPRFVLNNDVLELTGVPVPLAPRHTRAIYALRRTSAFFCLLFDASTVWQESRGAQRASNASLPAERPTEQGVRAGRGYALTRALIARLRAGAEENGARFMVLSTAFGWDAAEGEYGDLLDCLRRDGIPVLDVDALPDMNPQTMIYPGDLHWTKEGHGLVAEKLMRFVTDQRLLEPDQQPE